MATAPPPLRTGAQIGGYELVRQLGEGGMAEVWVARKVTRGRAGKYVALKILASHLVGKPRYDRLFRQEAELSELLTHANIVQVFDEGEHEGRSFMVMEWVDGYTLRSLTTALGFVSDEQRIEISAYVVGQLLHALSYAHSITHAGHPMGVVHRDISPQNVLVSNAGDVKLTDFGVAHHAFGESSGLHLKGKLRYMAPEQLAGRSRAPAVDLFGVGALLHELLDGSTFRGELREENELYRVAATGTVPKLTRPAPPKLEALRVALLQPRPENRPTSAARALRMLSDYGYRDMRVELADLSAALTGVAAPRTGPERPLNIGTTVGNPGESAGHADTLPAGETLGSEHRGPGASVARAPGRPGIKNAELGSEEPTGTSASLPTRQPGPKREELLDTQPPDADPPTGYAPRKLLGAILIGFTIALAASGATALWFVTG